MFLNTVTSFQGGATSFAVAPGENNMVYICTQRGIIRKYDLRRQEFVRGTFLDLTEEIARVHNEKPMKIKFADERGLLRLAFHPEYNTSGSLFQGVFVVMHSEIANFKLYPAEGRKQAPNPDHMTCIAQYKYTPSNTAEQNKQTRMNILCVPEPEANHNGGAMLFGPDGYLWLGLGDGGGANDEHGTLLNTKLQNSYLGNAQNLNSLHGKMLRIEIVQPMQQKVRYNIPQDNPFVGKNIKNNPRRSEIVAWGLRNPWSIDINSKGEIFVGDVGQNRKESVNIIEIGNNYGWRATEGDEVFNKEVLDHIDKSGQKITPPILAYPRKNGVAIVGIHYYEGQKMPYLRNHLIFVDYSGSVMLARKVEEKWIWTTIRKLDYFLTGMGVDAYGEPYLLGFDLKTRKGYLQRIEGVAPELLEQLYRPKIQAPILTDIDVKTIISNGVQMANKVKSALRKDSNNQPTNVKMHFAIIQRGNSEAMLIFSMKDAWEGSKDIAKRKANTAMSFSSDQNALTSRTVGVLSQPGGALWQIGNSNPRGGIIEFPGGIPLYKNGRLVGAVGVSGDAVDQDETVAVAASKGLEAPKEIRSDIVAKAAYVGKPAAQLVAPGTTKETPKIVKILGRNEWVTFKQSKDYQSPIALFISGDRVVRNLSEFMPFAKQFITINFFATKLRSLLGINRFINLTSLNVSRSEIGDVDVRELSVMVELTRLELNGNDISDISPISGLVNLRKLGLACTFIKELPIEKMKKLKVLDVYQTPLDNNSVKVIRSLDNLQDVDIRKTNITDSV